MTKRVGLYLRVSTKNGQTVENQRQALGEAINRRQGWLIVEEFVDHGISGAKSRSVEGFDRKWVIVTDLIKAQRSIISISPAAARASRSRQTLR
jgi:hypothetical protein